MEVTTCREQLSKYCTRTPGLDIGFGGEPIVPHAICLDREPGHDHRAQHPNPWPTHVVGDAENPWQFRDESMAWVFSSHTLEDFEDTAKVLCEWWRLVRPGGYLVLFLPDQKSYVAFCELAKALPNQAHKHANFGPEYVVGCLKSIGVRDSDIIEMAFPFPGNPYSFSLVAKKSV